MRAIRVDANGALTLGSGEKVLKGCSVMGAAISTLRLYNDASAVTGNLVASIGCLADDSKSLMGLHVKCNGGIFAVISGSGAEAMVYVE
jgi:hypothetical protein